jgi:hypothetical protein
MKKRVGRPNIGTNNAKSVFMSARFTRGEAVKIKDAVARSGLSRSDFFRKCLLSASDVVNVTQ